MGSGSSLRDAVHVCGVVTIHGVVDKTPMIVVWYMYLA